jgi:hypothetical protein
MKRLILLFIFVSLWSCKTKVPVFEIYQEVNFTIPSGKDPIATHHFLIHDIPSFLKANLKQKGLKSTDLTEFYAGKGKIESIVYSSNFGIIGKMSVWIYKKDDYNNSTEIYYRDNIPITLKGEIKLLSTGEDVRDILLNDKYEMDIEIQFKNFVTESIDCRFTFKFDAYIE